MLLDAVIFYEDVFKEESVGNDRETDLQGVLDNDTKRKILYASSFLPVSSDKNYDIAWTTNNVSKVQVVIEVK